METETAACAACGGIPAEPGRVPPEAVGAPGVRSRCPDKLNGVDFRWYVLRPLPRQELVLAGLLAERGRGVPNILEWYCPVRPAPSASRGGGVSPLFAGRVFVLSTRRAAEDFLSLHYPEGVLLYGRSGGVPRPLTVPEDQMRAFMDFNENYAERSVVLERPYSDYAFNPGTGEPNEAVRVLDGPLAGRVGYLVRYRRGRGLVFEMGVPGGGCFAVCVPDVRDFRVSRLHNAACDRQTEGTRKSRAADLLVGILQGCGAGERACGLLHALVEGLALRPSLAELRARLCREGLAEAARRVASLGAEDASLLLDLARYERENAGYARSAWRDVSLRPFLTPTSGVGMPADGSDAVLRHSGFTELVRRTEVEEETYYPSAGTWRAVSTAYYAHVGVVVDAARGVATLFANWDAFLGEYFLTRGRANEKLVSGGAGWGGACPGRAAESFRVHAPTLYGVLADPASPVRAVRGFPAGGHRLDVLAAEASGADGPSVSRASEVLVGTCVAICREVNSSARLAVWRRYLRGVWLHA